MNIGKSRAAPLRLCAISMLLIDDLIYVIIETKDATGINLASSALEVLPKNSQQNNHPRTIHLDFYNSSIALHRHPNGH